MTHETYTTDTVTYTRDEDSTRWEEQRRARARVTVACESREVRNIEVTTLEGTSDA